MVDVAVTSRSFSKDASLRIELQQHYSNVRFNEKGEQLYKEDLVRFLEGAERAIIGLETVNDALLSQLPALKTIVKMGTGIDKIDRDALCKHEVAFANTPGVNKRSVAELVIAHMITLLRHLSRSHQTLLKGGWKQHRGSLLTGKCVGVVGFGAVGQEVVRLLKIFDCRCLVYDTRPFVLNAEFSHVVPVTLDKLLQDSDIVTLHIPLTRKTKNFISSERLAMMKPSSYLINTARGGLVDESALKIALQAGRLAGAGFDVFAQEPPVDKALLNFPNFFSTAHIGGSTDAAILAMGRKAIQCLETATVPMVEGVE